MSTTSTTTQMRRWWGQRWLELLDRVPAAAARRVQRGRALARRGAVEDLRIAAGEVAGMVVEDRASQHVVTIGWPVPDDVRWQAAIDALTSELRFAAALLEGDLPHDLAEVLDDAGVALFPDVDELTLSCPCEDRADLCRHVAALHAAAAAVIDRDPTVLLELRGRTRDQLLRLVRSGPDHEPVVTGVDATGTLEVARADLEAIELRPTPVDDPAAAFTRLGPPPGVDDPRSIEAIIERAAAGAWRLAAGEGAEAADQELLLTQLRAQRVASAASLADALGRDPDAVRAELDRLFDEGAVLRTGSGERARYRAASS